jgi:hypothetical protein
MIRIREELEPGEILKKRKNYEKLFLSDNFGIALEKRALYDEHLCFRILFSYGDTWKILNATKMSTMFAEELGSLMKYVVKWCESNCDSHLGGWRLKKENKND